MVRGLNAWERAELTGDRGGADWSQWRAESGDRFRVASGGYPSRDGCGGDPSRDGSGELIQKRCLSRFGGVVYGSVGEARHAWRVRGKQGRLWKPANQVN